ncbi:condensin-2 complex subunit H2-like [Anneissia japonica]|uniref:condensin-2 complex subunit H2-like n=1 Tax=Anneissia japonica TaxID=1529436 RepID=UPI001425507A|nr:condensin-2 complex subunit H2-like [Anneissia japonica]
MNFAEAALLIQGSACIYSKKVEYLYTLVYQTLDLLANRRKQQLPSSLDNEGNDEDVSVAKGNIDREFLLLDDVKDSNNVDMKDGDHNDNVIQLMVQTPMSLQKLDDVNKDTPLLSQKGEMLGNRSDFRFNTGSILPSGLLLMDTAQLLNIEASLGGVPQSTPVVLDNDFTVELPMHDAMPKVPDIPEAENGIPEPHDVSLDDVEMGDPMEHSFEEQEQQVAHRMELRSREREPIKITPAKVVDPWQAQDPHEGDAMLHKPFKKGNPAKLPPPLETSKKRKRRNTQDKAPLQTLTDFISKAYNTYSNKLPTSALKRPAFRELEYLYWQEFRRQQQVFRNEKKSLARQGRYQELVEREREDEENQAEGEREENPLPLADDNGPDDFGFANDDIDDDDDDIDQQAGGDHVKPSETEEPHVSSYEDLVRHHVESYLDSAQRFAQLTELSKRVSEWEDKMAPLLIREEKFGFFDIHEYGTKVLKKLAEAKDTKEVKFKEVVSDTRSYDVCRLFLSSLQLANSRNIDITCDMVDGLAVVDSMRLTLLQQERHHEQLANYLAPSFAT